MSKLWQSPTYSGKQRRAVSIGQKRVWKNPKTFELHSRVFKQLHKNKQFVRKMLEGRKVSPNKAEMKLSELLRKYFPGQFKLNVKGPVILGGKVPDFVSTNGKKVVVELFGNYWHGRGNGKYPYSEVRKRKRCFSRLGYTTVIVWEKELKKRSEDYIVSKIARGTGLV